MPFHFVSYVDNVVPEIVGIGLFNDAYGYAEGAELTLALSRILLEADDRAVPLIGYLNGLSSQSFDILKNSIDNSEIAEQLKTALTPISTFFPEHNLGRLGSVDMDRDLALDRLKYCVGRLMDRFSVPACAAMANLYYAQAIAGKVHINQGLRVPNLEAIIADPESDDANHAGSHVRTYAQRLIGRADEEIQEPELRWPELFWHRCYNISSCDILELADDQPG
jgi:hypothetical protein